MEDALPMVIVAYYPHDELASYPDTVFVMRNQTQIDELKERLKDPTLTGVALIGPGVAYGWRVYTERDIHFVERPVMRLHETAQLQAMYRIVSNKGLS